MTRQPPPSEIQVVPPREYQWIQVKKEDHITTIIMHREGEELLGGREEHGG